MERDVGYTYRRLTVLYRSGKRFGTRQGYGFAVRLTSSATPVPRRFYGCWASSLALTTWLAARSVFRSSIPASFFRPLIRFHPQLLKGISGGESSCAGRGVFDAERNSQGKSADFRLVSSSSRIPLFFLPTNPFLVSADSLALEMEVTDPSAGLDAFTAQNVMTTLKEIANSGVSLTPSQIRLSGTNFVAH